MVVLEYYFNYIDLDMDKIILKDVSCIFNDLGEFNVIYLWMKVLFDSCMIEYNIIEDIIIYFNSIVVEIRVFVGSVLIFREF